MKQSLLITGANSDIGQSSMKVLLESGMHVIAQVRSSKTLTHLKDQYGSQLDVVESNLSNYQDITSLWNYATNSSMYPLNAIIYAAAIATPMGDVSPEEMWQVWQNTMDVNVIAPALLMKLAADHFHQHHINGTVIMITSRAIHQGDDTNKMHYAASKAALANMIKTAAKNYDDYPMHVYNIAPGFVETKRIIETIMPHKPENWIKNHFPLGSLVNPQEIADLILFLLTKPMGYMSGATFDINGATYLR
ncbi:MAG: SDR family oxidoreductase [Rickettsiales bacterium]|nr:SDR family oxidoreductase [Rickettsiales bacterium]